MSPSELRELVALGRERASVEFKRAGKCSEKAFATKIVRAVMAMANRRDGGTVVIGVDESAPGKLAATGVDEQCIATWTQDNFADVLAAYAEPFIDFDLELVVDDTRTFV